MARLTRAAKIVRKVKASSYGTALRVANQSTQNKYAGKPYGPHRTKIAGEMKRIRKHIKGRWGADSKYGKGTTSVDMHYLR